MRYPLTLQEAQRKYRQRMTRDTRRHISSVGRPDKRVTCRLHQSPKQNVSQRPVSNIPSRHPLITIANHSTNRRHYPRQGPRAASSITRESPAKIGTSTRLARKEKRARSSEHFNLECPVNDLRLHNRQPANLPLRYGVAVLNLGMNTGTSMYPSTSLSYPPHHMQSKKKKKCAPFPLGRRSVDLHLSRFGRMSWIRFAGVGVAGGRIRSLSPPRLGGSRHPAGGR